MVRLNGCSRKTASEAPKAAAHGCRSAPGCFGWWSQHRVEQVLSLVSRTGREADLMKLGLQLGYWGAQPPENAPELVAAAEEAGFDTVFTAEAWGSDAYTPLAWWGASTQPAAPGHLGGAAVRAHPDRLRDGRVDAGPSVRRAPHPWSWRVGPAGRRGLVRPEVSRSRWPAPASTSTSSGRCGAVKLR